MESETAARIEAFFEFVCHRQEIWHKRTVQQLPPSWTEDHILRDFKFCNVYRQLDGGTVAIRKYIENTDITPEKKLFNIIAYRFFNRRDTIEHLFGGLLDPETFDFKYYEHRFDNIKQSENIFSNAYLITAHAYKKDYRPKDKHVQILLMLNDLRQRLSDIIGLLQAGSPQDGLQIIERSVPMAGAFLSGQILLDAAYARDIVAYSGDDFLIVGPGAHWGLNIIFDKKLSKKEADSACRYLYAIQPQEFAKLKTQKGLDWNTVRLQDDNYPNAPFLMLHDIQNSLCEFRKYWRLKHAEKAKKRYFSKK